MLMGFELSDDCVTSQIDDDVVVEPFTKYPMPDNGRAGEPESIDCIGLLTWLGGRIAMVPSQFLLDSPAESRAQ